MRATSWLKCLCKSLRKPPLTFGISEYDEQIRLDICRTFPENEWFTPHHRTLISILNAFCLVNEGLGYPQGLNFLVFPLFYVYHNDNKKTAVENTFYSLHGILRFVLPTYPLNAKDTNVLKKIEAISNLVCYECYEKEPELAILLEDPHKQFMVSIVCNVIPTLYANVFDLENVLLLWDGFFSTPKEVMFQKVVGVLVKVILFHKNIFIHLSPDKSFQIFHSVLRESISACA